MGTWNSRGLRGSTLEDFVNRTNEYYMEKNLALIQKIPTPITPVRMDKEHRQITLAYFEQRSTVDYIGVVQGIPVCFDAKECVADTFPLQNIHEHQIEFMGRFEKQEGIAFFLLYYSAKNILYYMRYEEMMKFWNRAKKGGRKSFRLEELEMEEAQICFGTEDPGALSAREMVDALTFLRFGVFWNAEEERPGLLLDLGFSRDITDEVLAVTMDCEKRVMNVAHES